MCIRDRGSGTVVAEAIGTVVVTGTYEDHSDSVTVTVIAALRNLNVFKAGTGTGDVVSSPSGINCGNDCIEDYGPETDVTLTATPSTGYIFCGWSGDCSSNASTITIKMTTSKECTATFDYNSAQNFTTNPIR